MISCLKEFYNKRILTYFKESIEPVSKKTSMIVLVYRNQLQTTHIIQNIPKEEQ